MNKGDVIKAAAFERISGYYPVRSKDCTGCVSWPWATCFSCHEELLRLDEEHRAISCADEGDW